MDADEYKVERDLFLYRKVFQFAKAILNLDKFKLLRWRRASSVVVVVVVVVVVAVLVVVVVFR